MRRNSSVLKIAAALMASVFFIAGCATTAPAPAPTPAPATPGTPAAPPKPVIEKPNLKLGVSVKDIGFLPVYIADAKGFWKDEGLNIELVSFAGGSAQLQALAGGAVDFGVGAITEPMDAYIVGRDIKAFYAESNYPVYVWYGKPQYNSINDLKGGGKIAISRLGSLTHQISAWVVQQAGMDPEKDVQYIQAGSPLDRVAALQSGQVDAIPATPPGIYLLERDGYKPLVKLADYLPEFQYEVFYASSALLKANPETFRAVIRGWVRAVQWAKDNKSEATDILVKYLGTVDSDRPDVAKAVDFMMPYFREDGVYAEESIKVLLQFSVDKGDLKAMPPLTDILDYSFIEYFKANPVIKK